MKLRKAKARIGNAYEANPVRIVADGVIGTRGVGGGRLIPHLILDTSDRPDVKEP